MTTIAGRAQWPNQQVGPQEPQTLLTFRREGTAEDDASSRRYDSLPLRVWHAASPLGSVPGDAHCLFLVPHALSLVCEGIVSLSRPRALCPLCSVHVGYIHLLLQSLLHACMAYHGLCLWPLVSALWWTHQDDHRPRAQSYDNVADGRRQRHCQAAGPCFIILGSPPHRGNWSWTAGRLCMKTALAASVVGGNPGGLRPMASVACYTGPMGPMANSVSPRLGGYDS